MVRRAHSCGRARVDTAAPEAGSNVLANVNYVSRIRGHVVSILKSADFRDRLFGQNC